MSINHEQLDKHRDVVIAANSESLVSGISEARKGLEVTKISELALAIRALMADVPAAFLLPNSAYLSALNVMLGNQIPEDVMKATKERLSIMAMT